MKQIVGGICVAVLLGAAFAADLAITGSADARLANLAMRGERDRVRALLEQHVDVNAPQGDGMTALHWAAMKNDVAMAQMLLAAGADPKAVTRVEALTPLALAAREGHAAVIAALLKAKADPNLPNDLGTTPLMLAAASGDVDSVNALLAAGAAVNAKEKAHGQTALMFAAGLNRDQVIRVLAANHADLNFASAVTKVERLLVDADGNPLPAERPGQKARVAPRGAGAEFMGGWTALHFAARDGYLASVRALVESGADVNRLGDGDHTSVLIIALENGHFDLAKYLVERGVDVSRANDTGMTPAYAAIDCQWGRSRGFRFPTPRRRRPPIWSCCECLPSAMPISMCR
jgi:ankyrin repeat protein